MDDLPVNVVRSKRRKKTISARLKGGVLQIYLPANMSKKEEGLWISRMRDRIANRVRKMPSSDKELETRAERLNKKYFGGALKIKSIVFSDNQRKRFGSCTTSSGCIRISRQLSGMPNWVMDYVIVHELAHLIQPDHSKAFWAAVNKYRLSERARGYLMAKDQMEGD